MPGPASCSTSSAPGLYTCAACGAELFQSGTKFDSHCGWPSFYESIRPEAVELIDDSSHGMLRTEVRCATAARTSATSSRTASARRPATATA